MSSLTRTILILGNEFNVVDKVLEDDDAGESSACERTIQVDSTMPDSTKVETFYHEVAHMWLDLGGYSHLLGNEMSEALCQFLGQAVMQFVSQNESLPAISRGGLANE